MTKLPMVGLTLGLWATMVSPSNAATWTIDAAHSAARFRVRHLLISNVEGRLGNVTGVVDYDENDPLRSSVEATIDTKGIDTGAPERDAHLRSADFFDVERYPAMTFRSTRVEKLGDRKLKVTGDLTIRGVTRSVVLQVEGPTSTITDPWGNVKAGASAIASVNRKDYGISWNKTLDGGGLAVGDDVAITLEIEMNRK